MSAGPTDPEVAVTIIRPALAEAVPAALAAAVEDSAGEEPNRASKWMIVRAASALAAPLRFLGRGTKEPERAAVEQESGPESMTRKGGNALASPSMQAGSPATDKQVEVSTPAPAEQSQIPEPPFRAEVAGVEKNDEPTNENKPTASSAEEESSPADSVDSKMAVGKPALALDLVAPDDISADLSSKDTAKDTAGTKLILVDPAAEAPVAAEPAAGSPQAAGSAVADSTAAGSTAPVKARALCSPHALEALSTARCAYSPRPAARALHTLRSLTLCNPLCRLLSGRCKLSGWMQR